MPFTPAHAAAALPLRKFPFVLSALLVGTMAPDIEYFIRLAPGGGWGHTIRGAVCLSLPLGLVTLWMFHRFVKRPAVALLPVGIQQRAAGAMQPFRMSGARRFASIVLSLFVGIATHILWDNFTHRRMWMYRHWSVLRVPLKLPFSLWLPVYSLLQYVSSIGGLIALVWWFARWYRETQPRGPAPTPPWNARQKRHILGVMLSAAVAGGLSRAILGFYMPSGADAAPKVTFAGQFIVTVIAVLWWELVGIGVFEKERQPAYTRAQR